MRTSIGGRLFCGECGGRINEVGDPETFEDRVERNVDELMQELIDSLSLAEDTGCTPKEIGG